MNYITQELNKEAQDIWFKKEESKFLNNIDTFYYSVYIDYTQANEYMQLVNFLQEVKENYNRLEQIDGRQAIKVDNDLSFTGKSFGMYSACLEAPNKFACFFMSSVKDNIPQLILQLRAEYLWNNSLNFCVKESIDVISNFLKGFHVDVNEVVENRIDFAYHTNHIEEMNEFFDNRMLGENLVSNFKRWSKEGDFVDGKLVSDYISFGRRKSNNTFIRIYNKIQEVINLQHKVYFFDIWLKNGLISAYDYYIYTKAYEHGDYNYVDYYRLYYYLEYGQKECYRNQAKEYLQNWNNIKKSDIKYLADLLTPEPTLIVNFEFQLKRKFTSTLKLKEYNIVNSPELNRIYSILDNIGNIHDLITTRVCRFIDVDSATRRENCKNLSWWDLLRASVKIEDKIKREYIVKRSKKAIKKKFIKNVANYSAFSDDPDKNMLEHILSMIEEMNENDLDDFERYKKIAKQRVEKFIYDI